MTQIKRTRLFDTSFPFASQPTSQQLEPEHSEVFNAWKTQDTPQTRGALLRSVQPVIDTAVQSYAGSTSPAVKSQAKMLALGAFPTYDPAKGTLKTHLLSQLQRLQRVAGQSNQIIHTPERMAFERTQLKQAEEELRDELGREASDMEIADRTGISLGRLAKIRQASGGVNSGAVTDPETGETDHVGVSQQGDTRNYDAWQQMVYYDLPDVDRVIMDYSLGLHGSPVKSTTEIARHLGITPGAVSQRKNRIQALLDEQYNVF